MRKSAFFMGLVAAAASLSLVPESTVQAEPAHVINFGTMAPADTPWSAQLSGIKKRLEADSGGRFTVKLFLGGSMGGELEMMQDVQKGERLQGGGFSTGAVGEALEIPELLMVELPYLFRDNKEADTILDEVLYTPVSKKLSAKGIKFYAWAENGWRNMGTRGGPTADLTELKKYKMRSQESPVHLDMWKALGVQAVAKPTTEVLPALNTKIIDGYDQTPLFSLAGGWVQPITHYTLTRHIYQPAAVVYSQKFYDGLPADLQGMLMKDAKAEGDRGRKDVRALEAELIDTIGSMTGAGGANVQVVTPSADQIKAYRQATKSVHVQFLASHPDMVPVYDQVKTKLQSMR